MTKNQNTKLTPACSKPLLPAGAVNYRQNLIRRTEQKLK